MALLINFDCKEPFHQYFYRKREMTEPPATELRLFVAMPLAHDALARAQATIEVLRMADTGRDVRWVRPEGLHVTLAFLGQVPREAVADVVDALAEVVRRDRHPTSPDGHPLRSRHLGLSVDAVELFPTSQHPQVIWYRVGGRIGPLTRLAYAVRASLSEIILIPDGSSFRPHATLGRVRSGRRTSPWLQKALSDHDTNVPATWNPDGIELWRSEMGVGGSRYEPLARLPFVAR